MSAQHYASAPINFFRDGEVHSSPAAERAVSMPLRTAATQRSVRLDSVGSAFHALHSNPFATPPPRATTDTDALEGDSSPLAAGINLVKCAVGAGSFSLPVAFKNAGFWPALFLTFALGALAAMTASWLTAAERTKSRELGRRLTYPELLQATFPGSSGSALSMLSLFGIVFTSVGVSVAYVDFIKGALTDVIPGATDATVMALMFPVVSLLALLRSFRYLAFTSILGDVAVAAGLIGTIALGLSEGHHPRLPPAKLDIAELPRAAGNIAFLFLIHVVILPIAQSMRDSPKVMPSNALDERLVAPHAGDLEAPRRTCQLGAPSGFGRVAWVAYALISVVNAGFGGLCFAMFGEATEPMVLDNLSKHSAGTDAIKLLLCVDLLFTIPMILAAGREIVEGAAMATRFGEQHEVLTQTVVRLAIVAVIFGIAAGIPNFGDVVSLIGGLANSLMGLILPPLFLLSRHRAALLVTLLGVVFLVSSTYFTLHDMIAGSGESGSGP